MRLGGCGKMVLFLPEEKHPEDGGLWSSGAPSCQPLFFNHSSEEPTVTVAGKGVELEVTTLTE